MHDVTILVVDDEPSLREIFASWLRAVGCGKVMTAADGREALSVLESGSIDLLITDVSMPVMDGVTLVRKMTQRANPMPSIVFVSGFGDVDQREMYGLGVEAFITKPFDQDELLKTVRTALAERSTLWLTPMPTQPLQAMSIQVKDIGTESGPYSIGLGRGGFTARTDRLLRRARVSFKCSVGEGERELAGQGCVRWNSRVDNTIGIEFVYLEPSCRSWVAAEINLANPRSFIPGS